MAALGELIRAVEDATNVKLGMVSWTAAIKIDENWHRGYFNELIGPLADPNNSDVRIFLNHRKIDGVETVQLMVQDADDDVFLNSNVEGVEQYQQNMIIQVS